MSLAIVSGIVWHWEVATEAERKKYAKVEPNSKLSRNTGEHIVLHEFDMQMERIVS